MKTDRDAREYVITVIEAGMATRDEFDIQAIARDLHDLVDTWDLSQVEHDDFWSTVIRHRKNTREESR